jgi:hypothetical protein
MRLYLALLTLTTSCGRYFVEDSLQPYVEDFAAHCRATTRVDEVVFGDLPKPEHLALCTTTPDLNNVYTVVTVRKETWVLMSELEKRRVMWHELLHCTTGAPDLYGDANKPDIMYAYDDTDDATVLAYWDANIAKYCN